MNIETIITRPTALALRDALYSAADTEALIADVERRHAACLATVASDVMNQTTEEGKPAFTNDTARKAAMELAAATSPRCSEIAAKLADLRRARAYALADAEALRIDARLTVAFAAGMVERS